MVRGLGMMAKEEHLKSEEKHTQALRQLPLKYVGKFHGMSFRHLDC